MQVCRFNNWNWQACIFFGFKLILLSFLSPNLYAAPIQALASQSLLLDIAWASDHWVVVGERGHILLSYDQGHTWQPAKQVNTTVTLTAVHFNNEQGWAVGHDGIILHSQDGGLHWQLHYQLADNQTPLLDISFVANQGFAIGAYGLFLHSLDAGKTWQRPSLNINIDEFHFNHLNIHANNWLISGEAGFIYQSQDQGQTWQQQLIDEDGGSFFTAISPTADSTLVFGLQGRIYYQNKAKMTWKRLATPNSHSLFAAIQLQDQRLIAVGAAGSILISNIDYTQFTAIAYAQRQDLAAVAQNPDGSLLLVGEKGVQRFVLPTAFQSPKYEP